MCYEQNVYITEEIAEKLTPGKDELEKMSQEEKNEQLLKIAKL